MKRIFQFFTALAVTLTGSVSCNPDESYEIENALPEFFRGSTETGDTRTEMGDDLKVYWQEDDSISVFAGSTANLCYVVSEGAGATDATFVRKGTPADHSSALPGRYAFYPYREETTISPEGMIYSMIPEIQAFQQGSFARGVNPMMAFSPDAETDTFLFWNVCGILKFTLTGMSAITSVSLRGNQGEPLSGGCTITMDSGKAPVIRMLPEASPTVTMDCGDGIHLSDEATTSFLFVIPPTAFSKGLTVTVKGRDGGVMECILDKPVTVERNVVVPLAPVRYKPEYNDGYVHFEDKLFEQYCLDEYDRNQDGMISTSEVEHVTGFWVPDMMEVTSLTGLEHFVSLESLYCHSSQLHHLDLHENTSIRTLWLSAPSLSSLILPDSAPLADLSLYSVQIGRLDLSRYPSLQSVHIDSSTLVELTLAEHPSLSYLQLFGSSLTSLDISGMPKLERLYSDHPLRKFVTSEHPVLKTLSLGSCELESLDLSGMPALENLSYSWGTIRCLDLSKNPKLSSVHYYGYSLKVVLMAENQNIPDLLLGYDGARVIRGSVLESSCETLEAESCGVAMRFSVISSSEYEILSVPDWVTLAPFSKDLLSDVYCEVRENSSEAPREAEILFRNEDGCTFTFKIHQNGSYKADDWVHRDFYHRSLIICHTMQGCGYSDNLHPLLYSFIDDPSDKESILMIYYPGGSERNMCFNGVEKMIDMYQFSSTPSGILDGREYIGLFVIDRDDIVRMVAETERDHEVRTGIELTSTATTDGLLNVDATVYCKKEGTYRLCIFLVEDNIVAWQNGKGDDYLHRNVAKLAVTDPCGDSFTVSEANSVREFSFHAAIPASCRRENLKILAYTLYEYGPPSFIHYPEDSGLDYYIWKYEGSIVDNSVTVNVGTYNPLALEDKKSGGNEDIHTGDSITFN